MRTLLESEAFRAELPGWALRGCLCAASSAFWAVLIGFQAPAEIAGMVTGVAVWVCVFAALCSWTPSLAWLKQPQMAAALKHAAWIKLGLSALGWLCFAGRFAPYFAFLQWLGLCGIVDMALGIGALSLVALLAGTFRSPEQISRLDSFGWTALTTVVEGALMAVLIGVIALAVLGWWRLKARVGRQRELSPARPAG